MKDWQKVLVPPSMTIVKTMEVINANKPKIALIVDDQERLLGAVTDGDIRRGLLRGVQLTDPVSEVANRKPLTAPPGESAENLKAMMQRTLVRQIPLVDRDRRILGLVTIADVEVPYSLKEDVWIILMAGGKGERLRPLTETTPKPMLCVGDKPLLETILENIAAQGFRKFFLSVHYKASAIRDHFGDGARWGVEIRYLEEPFPLGTAGALSLLPETPPGPVLVMNGDLLTKVDLGHMLDFHLAQEAEATMGVREYDIKIDFGVVSVKGHRIVALQEKPVHQVLVNAGIYILMPSVLTSLHPGDALDMPTLFQSMVDANLNCAVFPIVEYWLDIGRMTDFEQAKNVIAKF